MSSAVLLVLLVVASLPFDMFGSSHFPLLSSVFSVSSLSSVSSLLLWCSKPWTQTMDSSEVINAPRNKSHVSRNCGQSCHHRILFLSVPCWLTGEYAGSIRADDSWMQATDHIWLSDSSGAGSSSVRSKTNKKQKETETKKST